MEWVETTGRTVEEALDAALDELGVDENDVEYEVVEQPRTGLLARFSGGGARIRARVKPISREKPGERQRRNRRGGSGQGRSSSDRPSRSRSGNGANGDARPAPEKSSGAGSAPQGAGRNRPEGASPSTLKSGNSRRRGRRGGQGSRSAGRAPVSDESTPDEAPKATAPKAMTPKEMMKGKAVETIEPEVTIEEQAEAAEAFTQGLVDAFDLGAQVRSVIVDEGIVVDVTGESLGLLVGPRGATLNAIEELVRTVVQRQTDGHGVRINVDVAGYRAKRREALEEFTRGIAEKVLETGRPQALEPMSALDRKVVHDAASEIDGVETESQGEEPRRRVVLIPASADAESS
jgi:spoIIIJ-associated protein